MREAGEVKGVGGEVKGGRLFGQGVSLMLAAWMRFWLLPSCDLTMTRTRGW